MVEATESLAKETNLEYSFILHNGNPSFWNYMKYHTCQEEKIREKIIGLTIITPLNIVYKKL